MRNRLFIPFLICILFSCKKENMGDCFKSTGDIIEEDRIIQSFSKIELDDRINLHITYSQVPSLKIKAGENLQEHIVTDFKNNTLIIENDNRCNWVRSFKKEIHVFLSTPTLKEITYYGSGEVNFINQFKTDTLLVNLWEASGDLSFNLDANYVELKTHTGVGTITSKGIAKELVAYVGGNGFVDASSTLANRVLAVNENTGCIKVHVTDFLQADIRESGNIEYSGNPVIELLDEGKGNLIKVGD